MQAIPPPEPPTQVPTGYRPYDAPPVRPREGLAIASLVFGLLGVFTFFFYGVVPILAIVFGAVANGRSRRENGRQSGMATAGIVLGIVELTLFAVAIGVAIWLNANAG